MSSMDDDTSTSEIRNALSALTMSRKCYSSYNQSDTDTAGSDGGLRTKSSTSNSHRVRQKRKPNCGYHSDNSSTKNSVLPPIGVFWDIENCQVPRGRSAMCIAQLIRDLYFDGYREAEFVVVCDVRKETNQVIQELCDAQVNLIHVSSTSKNAADEKLRQCMRRFADTHGAPSAILLISGDVNFAADLSDLRHRKKIHVILLHKQNVSKALILCASENHCFTELTNSVAIRPSFNKNCASPVSSPGPVELAIRNLPVSQDSSKVKNRLKQLSDNCGGRVTRLDPENGIAVIRFPTDDHALRAQKRMDGEDVFGNKILATQALYWSYDNTPLRSVPRFRPDLLDMDEGYQTTSSSSIGCAPLSPMPPMPNFFLKNGSRSEPKQIKFLPQTELQRHNGSNFQQHFNNTSAICLNQSSMGDRNGFRSRTTNFNKYMESPKSSVKASTSCSRIKQMSSNINKHSNNFSQMRARSASPWQSNFQSQSSSNSSEIDALEAESPFCPRHCTRLFDQNWATSNSGVMPSVRIELKKLNENLCKLIDSHNGSVPIDSLALCYSGDIKEPLIIDQKSGVYLEHLILSCSGISVKKSLSAVKFIILSTDCGKNEKSRYDDFNRFSSDLAQNLQQLSKEFIILLRNCPKSLLPFDKLIQTYHNRFGKQCKIADYGFKKLIDLLEALSSDIQVIGESKNRIITLTHKAQKRIFASDLCRVLREQENMQILLSELSSKFTKVLERSFDITDYGVCFMSDMLSDLSDSIVNKKKLLDGDVILSRPKRVLSDIETKKINCFKLEVLEILSQENQHTMFLNKFAPAYNRKFGRQCKLSDYGFDKLIELFEAIPDIIEIIECPTGCFEERKIRLNATHSNMLQKNDDLEQTMEILLQSPPPSELPKPSLDLLNVSKDYNEHCVTSSFQNKRKSRLAAIFPSNSFTEFM